MVGVGVRAEQRNAMRDERLNDPAFVVERRHGVHAVQEERMVRHDQVGLQHQRLVDHGHHRIDGKQHAGDGCVRIATGQADGIPVGREPRGVAGFHERSDVAHRDCRGHAVRLPT